MDKVPMTEPGYKALVAEMNTLKSDQRPAIIKAIAEAREHGDLSENAEYHAAKEQQGLIEGRIRELESLIGRAEVIDVTSLSGPVRFGATVILQKIDEETGRETGKPATYQIVSEPEADLKIGRISIKSPMGRALIGKSEGDEVEVTTPQGERYYEVMSIRYI